MTKSKIRNKFKCQISNPKTKFLFFVIFALLFLSRFDFDTYYLFAAQDNEKIAALTKQIMETSADTDLYAPFEELKNLYFKDHKYQEMVELLKSLAAQKKKLAPFTNYYIAFARFNQLKYLEDTQDWDEYFDKGNTYRKELTEGAQKAIDSIAATDPLNIYAKLLLFKFHRAQQDVLSDSSLQDLLGAIKKYPSGALYLLPLKEAADTLLYHNEKIKAREIYKLYVDSIVVSGKKDDELKGIAMQAYNEKNLELAGSIYDVYIARASKATPKEKLIPLLFDIARDFSYKDTEACDPFYAERIFQKIEDMGTKDVFGEESMYIRAFNIEKIKEYAAAKDIYLDLVSRFSQSIHADEADFKIGIIHTYILRDQEEGRVYFTKLAQKIDLSPQVLSGLYQLGLLSQWEEDFPKAKEYYKKLLDRAGASFPEIGNLTRERLREIEEAKPIEYNLKTFLDLSLKEENAIFDTANISIDSSVYRPDKDTYLRISAAAYGAGDTGSMPSQIEYLWSGDLGTAAPSTAQAAFDTSHKQTGTMVTNLVAVTSAGFLGRNIDIVDVY